MHWDVRESFMLNISLMLAVLRCLCSLDTLDSLGLEGDVDPDCWLMRNIELTLTER